jgi:hypothetical protein
VEVLLVEVLLRVRVGGCLRVGIGEAR